MSEAVDWQLTQRVLQGPERPLVVKPRLQESLLQKPPFRFLHDVISEVMRNTGFAAGLYTEQELDARAITEKEAKMAFLQKMIDVVSLVLNQTVPARPSKIVAGLEPQNTNIFLQMLGRAALQGSVAQAVKVVLSRQHQQQLTAPAGVQEHGGQNSSSASKALPSVRAPAHPYMQQQQLQQPAGSPGAGPSLSKLPAASHAPSFEAHLAFDEDALEAEEGGSAQEVVFHRAHALLPQLTAKLREVQASLGGSSGTAAGPGTTEALRLCANVKEMCEDAAVLAKCVEGLQAGLDLMVREGAHWAKEAARLGQEVEAAERGLREAQAAWGGQLRALDAQLATART